MAKNPYALDRPQVISGSHAQMLLVEVTGQKELTARLQNFRESGIRRVMVSSIRAATKESAKFLKSAAPRKDIKKSIGWTASRLSSPSRAVAKAGVNVGKRPQRYRQADEALLTSGKATKQQAKKIKKAQKQGYATSALVWVVLGTVRRQTSAGANRGKMSATFSVQQSLQRGKQQVMHAARVAAIKQIDKEVAKQGIGIGSNA